MTPVAADSEGLQGHAHDMIRSHMAQSRDMISTALTYSTASVGQGWTIRHGTDYESCVTVMNERRWVGEGTDEVDEGTDQVVIRWVKVQMRW